MMLPRGGDAFIAPKVALGALRVAADCRRIRPQPEGSTGDFHMRYAMNFTIFARLGRLVLLHLLQNRVPLLG